MRHSSSIKARAAAVVAIAAMVAATAPPAAVADVNQVSGGAFGYQTFIGLFGGPPSLRGPAGTTGCSGTTTTACSPSVVLPAAGGTLAQTDPDGAAATYGPAVLHRSTSESVSTEASTGPSGSVTSSATLTFDQETRDPPFLADQASSRCSATEAGQSGSVSLTNATLVTSTDPDTGEPATTVALPADPAPNTEYEGTLDHVGDAFRIILNEQVRTPDAIVVRAFHMYLFGEIAVGDYILGESRCGVAATSANAAPVAADDAYTAVEDTPLAVAGPGVLANDTDADGHPLAAAKPAGEPVPTNPPLNCSGQGPCAEPIFFPTEPANGTVVVAGDGSFTYTPDPGFVGTDTFAYVAADPRGGTDTATVTVNVVDNLPPVAGDDAYRTLVGVPLDVAAPGVLANDTDPEGGPLTAGSASDPPNGTVVLDADGSFVYLPDPLFTGTDTFTYVVSDDHANTDTATVSVKVGLPNSPPDAVDDDYGTDEGVALAVAAPGVLANDTDPDGDTLTAGFATDPANGTVALGADGSFTYTPDPGFFGTDTFTYAASDGAASDTATVTITVAEVVAPPGRAVADFDGDGDTDVSVFRPSNGAWFLPGGVVHHGLSGDAAVPADYDGDGDTDVAVFRPSGGAWHVAGQAPVHFGLPRDLPVPADYDGDGAAEVAVFRPDSGAWLRPGQAPVYLGASGDIPVPADYDGDGDVAVFRPSNGGWYVSGQPTTYFGLAGDVPVPGDYDGDADAEIAVFRPGGGAWHRPGQPAVYLGRSGDAALPLPHAIRQAMP